MGDAVFLIGARAAGKTTIGGLLAVRLGLPFFDTDALLQESAGLTAAEIVESEGWPGFRRRESDLLRALLGNFKPGRAEGPFARVIATGGGLILDPANRVLLRSSGLVCFLKAPPKILAARLLAAPEAAQRPSLSGRPPHLEMREILRQRNPLYRETAHRVIDAARPLAAVLEQVCACVGEFARPAALS